jgi:hypothetical protein
VTVPVGPGQLYLIDTSAHARIGHPPIRNVIAGLIVDRAAATCVTVDLEAGYSGRDHAGFAGRGGWPPVPNGRPRSMS